MGFDNISDRIVRNRAARFVENGAGTYNWDIVIPAYAVIDNIQVMAEALWTAATSAVLNVGDYAVTFPSGVTTIGAEIDLNGFFVAVDLKATDLLAAQSIDFAKTGGKEGAYAAGTATHWNQRVSTSARILRSSVTSVGAGTAGRTIIVVTFTEPSLASITQ